MKTPLALALLLLTVGSCKKDAPEASLPAATQEGRNTGGCLINGEPFVATGRGGSLLTNPIPALSGGFYEDSLYYLTITGGSEKLLYLFFRSQSLGTFNFNQDTPTLDRAGLRYTLAYAACMLPNSNDIYITNSQHTGTCTLTKANTSTGISSGTFEFTAASTLDPSKTITITHGRFDRKQ